MRHLPLSLLTLTSLTGCIITTGTDGNPSPTPAPCAAVAQRAVAHNAPAANAFAPAMEADVLAALDLDASLGAQATLGGDPRQIAVFSQLGTLGPSAGNSFAWISTGAAGAGTPSSLDSSGGLTQPGMSFGTNCTEAGGAAEYDCASLTLAFVVPDGIHGVAFDFDFLSAEWPEYVGSGYSDRLVVSETSATWSFANIAVDGVGHPISTDSALMLETCNALTGTGFGLKSIDGNCDAAGTGRQTIITPVEPLESVRFVFRISDGRDTTIDSAVLLDHLELRASAGASTPTPTSTPVPTPTGCGP